MPEASGRGPDERWWRERFAFRFLTNLAKVKRIYSNSQ
jgi:hypothetical protein